MTRIVQQLNVVRRMAATAIARMLSAAVTTPARKAQGGPTAAHPTTGRAFAATSQIKATRAAVVCGLFVAVLFTLGFARTPSVSAHANAATIPAHALTAITAAHSSGPLTGGSCEMFRVWSQEFYYTQTYGSQTYTVKWDAYVDEERNWATWVYCGHVQTEACITTDSSWPFPNVGVTNLWYRDSTEVGARTRWSGPVPPNHSVYWCTVGDPYGVWYTHTAEVAFQYWDAAGGSRYWSLVDDCVGC